MATCSKHSGAPQLQGCVGEALVLKGPSQASPPHPQHLGLPCSGARPGLGLALCSQLPQPAVCVLSQREHIVQLASLRVSLKIGPHPGLYSPLGWERGCEQHTPQSLGH